jgi:hypothetical protein
MRNRRAFRRPVVIMGAAAVLVAAAGTALDPRDTQSAPAAIAQGPQGPANGASPLGGPDRMWGHPTTHIIVKLRPGVATTTLADGRPSLRSAAAPGRQAAATSAAASADKLSRQWRVSAIRPAMARGFAHPQRAASLGLDRFHIIEVPAGTDTPALASAVRKLGALVESAGVDAIGGVAEIFPNDTDFGMQYSLHNTGQNVQGTAGVIDADIDAPAAWDISVGDEDLVLAIIDSGVDPHVELGSRLLPGYYVIDDDDNTTDICNHGTHVAGIAAASGNNALGIAGVAWNVKVLPVRVLFGCSGFASNLAIGLTFAADACADVANMSLQFTNLSPTTLDLLTTAVEYADASGMVLVAAAGNFNSSNLAYPAALPQTIAVGATNNLDERWANSNFSPNLDVAAPGVNVWSLENTTEYDFITGTSMAAPHVAGLACLIWSVDPTLSRDDVRAIIQSTTDDVESPGFDNLTGHGRINAHAAVLATLAGIGPEGDLNGDDLVNGADLGIQLLAWGLCPACDADHHGHVTCHADLNGDFVVDGADLGMLLLGWTG